jgi:hypothetical protein
MSGKKRVYPKLIYGLQQEVDEIVDHFTNYSGWDISTSSYEISRLYSFFGEEQATEYFRQINKVCRVVKRKDGTEVLRRKK